MNVTQDIANENAGSKPRGFYCRPRGWRDDKLFANEPFTEREAWDWLCEHASYSDRAVEFNGKTWPLAPGEQVVSESKLAAAWRWHKSRVHRFLRRLQRAGWLQIRANQLPNQEANHLTLTEQRQISLTRTRERTSYRTTDIIRDSKNGLTEHDLRHQPNQKNGADAPSPSGAKNVIDHPTRRARTGERYAFEGRYIRLSESDFAAWERANQYLDLRSELQVREDWYRDNPPEGGKWFLPTSQWLANRNRKARGEANNPRPTPTMQPGSIEWYEIRDLTPPPGCPTTAEIVYENRRPMLPPQPGAVR